MLEEDTDGTATDIHRGSVTRGQMTVDVEDSLSWPIDERAQVLPPYLPETWISAGDARDLAAALLEAARLVEQAG